VDCNVCFARDVYPRRNRSALAMMQVRVTADSPVTVHEHAVPDVA
jgi:hypothetical protein